LLTPLKQCPEETGFPLSVSSAQTRSCHTVRHWLAVSEKKMSCLLPEKDTGQSICPDFSSRLFQEWDLWRETRCLWPAGEELCLSHFCQAIGVRKGLSLEEVSDILGRILSSGGSKELNRIRDQAKALAHVLSAEKEFAVLDSLCGAFLGTMVLDSPPKAVLNSRFASMATDSRRRDLFELLRLHLSSESLPAVIGRQEEIKNTGKQSGKSGLTHYAPGIRPLCLAVRTSMRARRLFVF